MATQKELMEQRATKVAAAADLSKAYLRPGGMQGTIPNIKDLNRSDFALSKEAKQRTATNWGPNKATGMPGQTFAEKLGIGPGEEYIPDVSPFGKKLEMPVLDKSKVDAVTGWPFHEIKSPPLAPTPAVPSPVPTYNITGDVMTTNVTGRTPSTMKNFINPETGLGFVQSGQEMKPWQPMGGVVEGSTGTAFTPGGMGIPTKVPSATPMSSLATDPNALWRQKMTASGGGAVGLWGLEKKPAVADDKRPLSVQYDEYVKGQPGKAGADQKGLDKAVDFMTWVKDKAKSDPEALSKAVAMGYIKKPAEAVKGLPQQAKYDELIQERKDAGLPVTGAYQERAMNIALGLTTPTKTSEEERIAAMAKMEAETGELKEKAAWYKSRGEYDKAAVEEKKLVEKEKKFLTESIDKKEKLLSTTYDPKDRAQLLKEIAAYKKKLGIPGDTEEQPERELPKF